MTDNPRPRDPADPQDGTRPLGSTDPTAEMPKPFTTGNGYGTAPDPAAGLPATPGVPAAQAGGQAPQPAPQPLAPPAAPHAPAQPAVPDSLGLPGVPGSVSQPMPPSVPSNGWSPLGATPSSPPTRSGPEPGGPRYLPPVAPPQSGHAQPALVAEERVTKTAGSRWGWRAFLSFLVGGLVAAAGFGAAQLAPSDDPADEAAAVTTTTQAVASTGSTPDAPRRNTGTVPLVPADVDEPAAFVHQELGPSVVQIEIPDVSLGSGVVFGDGLIMTNNHVVSGHSSVRVQLADGQVLVGEVLGADPINDVAVVSIGPGQDLPIARLATGEKARVGQLAIAIGSPFDLQQSVTAGIVSAVDRPVPNQGRYVAMIQTDAPINPGNSGGALADKFGRVIGINTSIQTAGFTSGNLGVGFAIPIDTALRIADLLVAGEPIEPGFLGVGGDEPTGGEAGVELTSVTEGSAAALAGLRVGDRVLSIDGAPVTKFEELAGLVLANQAGDTVVLEVERNGEIIEIQVTLGLRTED